MKTQQLGPTGRTVSSLALGAMRITDLTDAAIRELYATARELGVDVIDHADIYGGEPHRCERRFGDALRLSPSEREEVVIQTKAGIREGFYDSSAAHLTASVEESLRALRTDHVDLLLLHRPDTLVEPEEVAAALEALHDAGKVLHVGVSNHTTSQMELLRRAVRRPLVVNQAQLSLRHAPLVTAGLAANIAGLDQSADRDGGLLEHARLTGTTLQAWSPLQGTAGEGPFVGDRDRHPQLNAVLDELAAAHGVTPTGIAVAWITRHPADIQVVLGSTSPQRLAQAAAGTDVVLDRQEWYRLLRAAGHTLP